MVGSEAGGLVRLAGVMKVLKWVVVLTGAGLYYCYSLKLLHL